VNFIGPIPESTALRKIIEDNHRVDEGEIVERMIDASSIGAEAEKRIEKHAGKLVEGVRKKGLGGGSLDAFLHEYELSNQEGVTLMCLAEALLRIPDPETANKLIKDKIGEADWERHVGRSESLFVNASTWALMLTGRVVQLDDGASRDVGGYLKNLVTRSGEPVIRNAMLQAMKILGRQFVMGRNIDEALTRGGNANSEKYTHSFDMLGEAALTAVDAERYLRAYEHAIKAIGAAAKGKGIYNAPGVSVKLSALHPRYEVAQRERVMKELVPILLGLAQKAKAAEIGFCVDAEEADRLDISLDIIEQVSADPSLTGWNGFGLALQAYQKRAIFVIDWLADMARRHNRQLMVRLVKGAYWDTEIKRAQEEGQVGYPVFTRKASTDVCFLACAKKLLDSRDVFYPQFATHNAHTLAAVVEMAGDQRGYEFQRLHGMGETLYDQVVGGGERGVQCRVYAPVGTHEDLLAYLVRRLLENGANTSFVNRIIDEDAPIADLVANPRTAVNRLEIKPHPSIPLPCNLYGGERLNSAGLDLSDGPELRQLAEQLQQFTNTWTAAPQQANGHPTSIFEPANRSQTVGHVRNATPDDVEFALNSAYGAASSWSATPAEQRAIMLERGADLLEENMAELLALCVREAGKTLADSVPEIREAVDFLRYYATRCRADFSDPQRMPGPTGETNDLSLHGRGVFVCISPWNFPLAIFLGQVSAALAAGNAVIAKPAEQTPLIAAKAVELLYQAGIPKKVLHLLPGDGPTVGAPLVSDRRIAGVAFTGSTDTAKAINRALANRDGAIIPLIAETGGQNAMIVDSTALPEQVVQDAVFSAFRSAGQRCSALRVLFVQDSIADKLIEMLVGATQELRIDDPALLASDVGPVIDEDARGMLTAHATRMDREAKLLCQTELQAGCENGTFFAPRAYEIASLDMLEREVFGPILHVIRYNAADLDSVLDAVRNTGFGLTLGIHSRIASTHRYIHERLRIGNTYVNRNQIGASVGVQPFGGEGLSGTGPKAGGPRYLHRFAVERTLTINTTAAGGNAALMSMDEG
jgi:RHH-type transcriptional regulator, proline utilization regulon repressor / proline dehydrogenase / delta 1-pyrroline-5-carboxylate dehydrogenase